MILQSTEIVKELNEINFGRFWVTMIPPMDKTYYVPELVDVALEVGKARAKMNELGLVYKEEVGDCDDFALSMMAIVRAQAWLDHERRLPWPFGMALLTEPFGHALNFVRCREGWFQVEPQEDGRIIEVKDTEYGGFFLVLI